MNDERIRMIKAFMKRSCSTVESLIDHLQEQGIPYDSNNYKTVAAKLKGDLIINSYLDGLDENNLDRIKYKASLNNSFCKGLSRGMNR